MIYLFKFTENMFTVHAICKHFCEKVKSHKAIAVLSVSDSQNKYRHFLTSETLLHITRIFVLYQV